MARHLNLTGRTNPVTHRPWTTREITQYRDDHVLTWYHTENVDVVSHRGVMQLVPAALNNGIPHAGGKSILNIALGL